MNIFKLKESLKNNELTKEEIIKEREKIIYKKLANIAITVGLTALVTSLNFPSTIMIIMVMAIPTAGMFINLDYSLVKEALNKLYYELENKEHAEEIKETSNLELADTLEQSNLNKQLDNSQVSKETQVMEATDSIPNFRPEKSDDLETPSETIPTIPEELQAGTSFQLSASKQGQSNPKILIFKPRNTNDKK